MYDSLYLTYPLVDITVSFDGSFPIQKNKTRKTSEVLVTAGAALLEAFKDAKGLEPVPIGNYRGFAMSLTVEDFGREFVLTLKGQMTHKVLLGKDARGNLIRMENAPMPCLSACEGYRNGWTMSVHSWKLQKRSSASPFRRRMSCSERPHGWQS